MSCKGHLEITNIQDYTFDEQFQNYQRSGYAVDSSTNTVIGNKSSYDLENRITGKAQKDSIRSGSSAAANKKRRINLEDDEDDTDVLSPWITYKEDSNQQKNNLNENDHVVKSSLNSNNKQQVEDTLSIENSTMHIIEPDEEDEKWEKVNERKQSYVMPPRPARGSQAMEAKTIFHGTELFDYQGRSWTCAPSNLKPEVEGEQHDCYIPKKCIKKLTGHTKGVQALEYFPKTGHLLLSASMDGKCKVWDAHNSEMQVKRTYIGHTEGIRAMNMSNEGTHFLSSGFDRYIRYWDVETGQAIGTFSNRKMAYDVKFYPRDNNLFIVGCNDNKIYQWDMRSGQVCQEYNHHLQPCNTVTFFDDGKKFVSTSDDKKMLVWEFDIPVPIKYIADPNMHCIPSVSMHPSQEYFAAQSMDNKINIYACGEKVRPISKKVFQGHNNSGYACKIGFSPNGKFVVSGDGHGEVYFWDWKTTKCYRKFHAHDNGPCMAAVWHPLYPTRVATCGWDGLIKIWE